MTGNNSRGGSNSNRRATRPKVGQGKKDYEEDDVLGDNDSPKSRSPSKLSQGNTGKTTGLALGSMRQSVGKVKNDPELLN